MSLPVDIEEKYEVLHKLGEGGMGTVYRVRHRLLDEPRVVKVMQPQTAEREHSRERFLQEGRAAIRLRHPNVAQVHDFSVDREGRAYLVMELIDGFTLKELLAAGQLLPLPLVIEIAIQSLAAFGYLHRQGYLHRDIAPDNLMLTRDVEGRPLVKLIDLGLAKQLAGSLDLTVSGMFVGKVRYASPERFRQPATEPDTRSDLYSFGVVLYELLTGICPIRGNAFEELISAHLIHEIPGFEETDPAWRIPEGLRLAVLRALEKNPERRMASAEEFAHLIRPFRKGEVPSFEEILWEFELEVDVRSPSVALRDESPGSDRRPGPVATAPTLGVTELLGSEDGEEGVRVAGSGRWRRIAGVAAGIMVLAALGVLLFWLFQPEVEVQPGPTAGRVVVDARPWAEVTAVADAAGRNVPLDGSTFTPFTLSLPAGRYELMLNHPVLASPRSVTVEVSAEGVQHQTVTLAPPDLDAYFAAAGLIEPLREAGR